MSGRIRHELRREVVTEEFRTEFLGEFRPLPPAFEMFVLEPLKRNLADVSAVLDELCREYADVLWRLEHYPPSEGVEHFVFLSGPPDFPQIQPLARVDVRLSVAGGTVTWNVVRAIEPRPEWRMSDRAFEDLLRRRAKARALQAETKLGGGLPLPPARVLMRTAFDPTMPLGAWFMVDGRFMPSVVRHVKGGG